MNQVVLFEFEEKEIRVITNEHTGEPLWVAKDVCDVLGLSNVTKALLNLDEDERGLTKIQTPYGVQEYNVITESGLYSLILRSRKPEAKPFKRWVTHEVLPSIRKSGQYRIDSNENTIGINSNVVDTLNKTMALLENDHFFTQVDMELEHVQDTILILSDMVNYATRDSQYNVSALKKAHERINTLRNRINLKKKNIHFTDDLIDTATNTEQEKEGL